MPRNAQRTDPVKLIYWDGTGVRLFAKRLKNGSFCWRTCRTASFA
ncbi:IS66 family insertion sequence element accessory protein TnpB [Rhodopseudomonas rhenobacensis]